MVRLTDRPDMTIAVHRGLKYQNNNDNSTKVTIVCDLLLASLDEEPIS